MDYLKKANHYRREADNLRTMAGLDDNIETRETLLSVARIYDRLYLRYLALALPRASELREGIALPVASVPICTPGQACSQTETFSSQV